EQHDGEWKVKHDAHGAECGREGREEHDDGDDEPDVVRFPDRRDRRSDQLALLVVPRAARKQIPHASAVVGAASQHVAVEGEHDQTGDHLGQPDRGEGGGHAVSRTIARMSTMTMADNPRYTSAKIETRAMIVPNPTMIWKPKCTGSTGGQTSRSNAWSPRTSAFGS